MTLTAAKFMSMYNLKSDPKKGRFKSSGWYYVSARGGPAVIVGDHNSSKAEKWKSKWFFATKNWETATSYPPSFPVPTHYRTLGVYLYMCFMRTYKCVYIYL